MKDERKSILNRLFLVLGLLVLLPSAVVFQIFRINVVEGEQLRELWSAQAIDYIPIPAQRGSILDASGNIMVTNSVAYNVAVDPIYPDMTPASIDTICTILGANTNRPKSFYKRKITLAPRGSRYVVMGKDLSIDIYEQLHPLNLRGLILEEQYKRRYNYDSLAAHALGFVNHTSRGMTGIENYYNTFLQGEDGSQQVQRDRNNRIQAIVGVPTKQPVHGYNIHSTIDVHIQAIVEEELRRGISRSKADKGVVIVMDPYTGAVKALANYPAFNPNRPGSIDGENRRNYAISDQIEPGSTFKLVTALAALDREIVHENEIFETPESGHKQIHGQWMRDHDPLGSLTFEEVIQKSSNVATAEIAMRFSKNDFYQYIRNFGFGTPTNIDLPNEEEGFLRKPHNWSEVTLPWLSVGYEIQVTPMQIAQAYAAFANGGDLMQPYIVDKVTDANGNIVKNQRPTRVRTVADAKVFDKLLPIFEKVVSDSGTANLAQIDGLKIAGKTGTAQKYEGGRYRTQYRASFAGFFPSDKPRYVTYVLVDEPRTSIYGGTIAAPIFRNIALRLVGFDPELQKSLKKEPLPYIAIVPNVVGLPVDEAQIILKSMNLSAEVSSKKGIITEQIPEAGTKLEELIAIKLSVSEEMMAQNNENGKVQIPDVKGLSMRQAGIKLLKSGLNFKKIGSGTVHVQFPYAGQTTSQGASITLRGKALPFEQLTKAGGK